ncbi:MAG: PQQ-dependent sugar dehydrogenase [Gammaproteobacteria bacterium]
MVRSITGIVFLFLATAAAGRSVDGPPVPQLPGPGGSTFKRPVVVGWQDGQQPIAPPGFQVELWATDLDSGRWMYTLPNGDVLVSQARTETMGGFEPEVIEALTAQGMLGPSADNILLFRPVPGAPPNRHLFADGLQQPFGMVLHDRYLYVANTNSVVRYAYERGDLRARGAPEKVFDVPAGETANPWNNHWTRNLTTSPDGSALYLTVGAGTDANADGNEHPERAAIWELKPDESARRLFATGLRNPVGLAFDPRTGDLWTTVNERDGIGADVPPDYLTRVVDGAFYGWPYVYFGTYPDPTWSLKDPAAVAAAARRARVPDLALGGHSVPLGLLFYKGGNFPDRYRAGAFVARRAGVGRASFIGPDVLFIPFENGSPTGKVAVFLDGFVQDDSKGTVRGRAVGLAQMADGSLLVSDDGANVIWRVSYVGE